MTQSGCASLYKMCAIPEPQTSTSCLYTHRVSPFLLSQSSGGQSKRDELFGGRRDVETGSGGEGQSAEAKLAEADHYQDKTEEAYKVREVYGFGSSAAVVTIAV